MASRPERAKFDCPSCKVKRHLEVVSSDAVLTQEVDQIGPHGYFDVTGYSELHSVGTHRFQCEICGHVVANDLAEYETWVEETFGLTDWSQLG